MNRVAALVGLPLNLEHPGDSSSLERHSAATSLLAPSRVKAIIIGRDEMGWVEGSSTRSNHLAPLDSWSCTCRCTTMARLSWQYSRLRCQEKNIHLSLPESYVCKCCLRVSRSHSAVVLVVIGQLDSWPSPSALALTSIEAGTAESDLCPWLVG